MRHKFEIMGNAEFNILKDVDEGVIMSTNYIPKKTPHSNRPPTLSIDTMMINAASEKQEDRQPNDDEVNHQGFG